jgi:hypothetical protein
MSKPRLVLGLAVAVLCSLSSVAFGGDPVNRDGQWGLGAFYGGESSGFGIRHWFTDGFGVDVGYSFTYWYGSDTGLDHRKATGLELTVLPCFLSKGNVRLEGLGTLQYGRVRFGVNDTGDEYRRDTYTAGIGLALEYYFDELPQMTFGASLIGVSFTYAELESASKTAYPKTLQTNPGIGFSVRYYF